jgi:transcriptional regulator with XRE-family HTH domain
MARSAAEPAEPSPIAAPAAAEPAAAPGAASWESVVDAIGPKVRDLRQRAGLSLQQLARRADVSAAAIHKVERGDMVPTITTLLKLTGALGRPISYFVDDTDEHAPVAIHTRAADQPGPPQGWAPGAEGVTARGIALSGDRTRPDAVHVVLEPGATSGVTGPVRRGEHVLLVLDGTLEVDVADEHYLVEAGDTLEYPADRSHSWYNPGRAPARAIWWLLGA